MFVLYWCVGGRGGYVFASDNPVILQPQLLVGPADSAAVHKKQLFSSSVKTMMHRNLKQVSCFGDHSLLSTRRVWPIRGVTVKRVIWVFLREVMIPAFFTDISASWGQTS